jgi:hypothetical protein
MKSILNEYIDLTDDEKRILWDKCIFVFDTNVLLNLYRYSQKTRETLLNAMNTLQDRIWIPYNVAEEYHKRRCGIVYETLKKYEDFSKIVDKFISECQTNFRLEPSDKEILQLRSFIDNWFNTEKANNLLVTTSSSDTILNNLLDLFDKKVGTPYDPATLKMIREEGARRYENNTPPGYKDANKKNGNDYGDYIIWRQIMDYAKQNNNDILLITNDQKEDWWYIISGRTIGPRIELRKEFKDYTGNILHMYSMDGFIGKYGENRGVTTDQSVLDEVKEAKEWFYFNVEDHNDNENTYYKIISEDLEAKRIKLMRQQSSLKLLNLKYRHKEKPDIVQKQIDNLTGNIWQVKLQIASLEKKLKSLHD